MATDWWIETGEGRWTANALRRLPPPDTPVGWTGVPRRAYVAHLPGQTERVASVRRLGPNGWAVKINGHEFRVRDGMGAHRFGLPWVDVHVVKSSAEGRALVERLLRERPDGAPGAAVAPDPTPG